MEGGGKKDQIPTMHCVEFDYGNQFFSAMNLIKWFFFKYVNASAAFIWLIFLLTGYTHIFFSMFGLVDKNYTEYYDFFYEKKTKNYSPINLWTVT